MPYLRGEQGPVQENRRVIVGGMAIMIENLSREQLEGISEAIPVEISFVDEHDSVRFWNKHDTRIFKRPLSVVGKSVQDCHPR